MPITAYFIMLWRYAWLIFLGTALATGAALLAQRQIEPVYRAKTLLLVNQGKASRDTALNQDPTSEQLANTYLELLSTRPILSAVISSLSLPVSTEELENQITISRLPDTQLIEISINDSDPQRAAHIVNEVVRIFNQQEATLLANPYAARRAGLHVVEAAVANPIPVSPRPVRNSLIAAAIGLLAAVGLVLLLEYLNDTVQLGEAVEAVTGLPLLASVGWRRSHRLSGQLVMLKNHNNSLAETYRRLRVGVEFATQDNNAQIITVTSPGAGEGKSTVATNLAVAFAFTGKRTILIDTDLRKPALHNIFECENKKGVSTAIFDDSANITNHFTASNIANLDLLFSGSPPMMPTELLGSQQMQMILAELRRRADIIIIDTTPVLLFIDAAVIAHQSDAVLICATANQTRLDDLKATKERLQPARAQIVGVVLNKVRKQASVYSRYTNHQRQQSLITGDTPAQPEQARLIQQQSGAMIPISGTQDE